MKSEVHVITKGVLKSHPAWGARIEMRRLLVLSETMPSHPAWGARIEMSICSEVLKMSKVAPRMGCAD